MDAIYFNPECSFRCLKCGHIQTISSNFFCNKCNSPVECNYGEKRLKVRQEHSDVWRFADILPILPHSHFTCPETPIVNLSDLVDGYQIYGKVESKLPSISTKYRQCSMAVPTLIALGIKSIVIVSSGNTGSSYMYWADKCEGELNVHTFASKAHAHRLYFKGQHSEIHVHTSTIDSEEVVARQFAQDNNYFLEGGFVNPFRREGLKTSYLEGLMQLDWEVDVVFQAISSGMGIVGAHSAFNQLLEAGIIKKMPKIVCVQQDTCNPMYRADQLDLQDFPESMVEKNPHGIAEAILRGNPTKSYPHVRNAVKKSHGCFCSVSEQEIIDAYGLLNNKKINACHTAATTLAAVRQLSKSGWLKPGERSLIMLTGGNFPPQTPHVQ